MPSTAAPVLIPAAERLGGVGKARGDFLGRQNGSDSLDLAYSGGGGESLTVSDAAAHYLDVLSNATHGYGTAQSVRVNRMNALAAHHNGGIPHDLVLLGYLYLPGGSCGSGRVTRTFPIELVDHVIDQFWRREQRVRQLPPGWCSICVCAYFRKSRIGRR